MATGRKIAEVATMIGWNEEDPPQLQLTYILLRPVSALAYLGNRNGLLPAVILAGFFIPHFTVETNLGQPAQPAALGPAKFQVRVIESTWPPAIMAIVASATLCP